MYRAHQGYTIHGLLPGPRFLTAIVTLHPFVGTSGLIPQILPAVSETTRPHPRRFSSTSPPPLCAPPSLPVRQTPGLKFSQEAFQRRRATMPTQIP